MFYQRQVQTIRICKLTSRRHLSVKETREILKVNDDGDDHEAEYTNNYSFYQTQEPNHIQKAQRVIDKSILLLKVAMNRLDTLIENIEDEWIIHEILICSIIIIYYIHRLTF